MYYVMYDDESDYETTVVPFSSALEAVAFIENKVNEQGYRLDVFNVIEGRALGLRAVKTPIKVLITNQP